MAKPTEVGGKRLQVEHARLHIGDRMALWHACCYSCNIYWHGDTQEEVERSLSEHEPRCNGLLRMAKSVGSGWEDVDGREGDPRVPELP